MPLGNDLLIVGLTVRDSKHLAVYVFMAAIGSMLGVLLMHLVAHKGGEKGITKLMSQKRFDYLKRKIEKYGGKALILGCLAPPPFPFTLLVAAASALGYPRTRLLYLTLLGRALRFTIVGLLAEHFGRAILRIAQTPHFVWSMIVFVAICLIGSAVSIAGWVRRSKRVTGEA